MAIEWKKNFLMKKNIEFHTRSSDFYFPENHLAPFSGHFDGSNFNNHDVWWKSHIFRKNKITNENSSTCTSFWQLILKRFKDILSSGSSLVSRCNYWSLHGWFFPISGHIAWLFKRSTDWLWLLSALAVRLTFSSPGIESRLDRRASSTVSIAINLFRSLLTVPWLPRDSGHVASTSRLFRTS